MIVDGVKVTFLRKERNPLNINWDEHDVRLVVDTTGQFLDPTVEAESPKGSLRGTWSVAQKKSLYPLPLKSKTREKDFVAGVQKTVSPRLWESMITLTIPENTKSYPMHHVPQPVWPI
jgi:glyceraldehyde 3-phosphate dehydrogenase